MEEAFMGVKSSYRKTQRCTCVWIAVLFAFLSNVRVEANELIDLNTLLNGPNPIIPQGDYQVLEDVLFSQAAHLKHGMKVDSNVTLGADEHNPVIIDCNDLGRAFHVIKGGRLILKHFIIKNGKPYGCILQRCNLIESAFSLHDLMVSHMSQTTS